MLKSHYINVEVEVDIFDEMTESELAELLSDEALRQELKNRSLRPDNGISKDLLNGIISNLPKHKAKDILCDILSISRTSSYFTMCEAIANLI